MQPHATLRRRSRFLPRVLALHAQARAPHPQRPFQRHLRDHPRRDHALAVRRAVCAEGAVKCRLMRLTRRRWAPPRCRQRESCRGSAIKSSRRDRHEPHTAQTRVTDQWATVHARCTAADEGAEAICCRCNTCPAPTCCNQVSKRQNEPKRRGLDHMERSHLGAKAATMSCNSSGMPGAGVSSAPRVRGGVASRKRASCCPSQHTDKQLRLNATASPR